LDSLAKRKGSERGRKRPGIGGGGEMEKGTGFFYPIAGVPLSFPP